MNANVFRGAVLLVALVLILMPAAVVSLTFPPLLAIALLAWLPYIGNLKRRYRFSLQNFWADQLGAVSTFYFARSGIPGGGVLINGSATPPTAQQASQCPMMKVQIIWNIADTQATITHNWGLDASAVTYFDPEIIAECQNGSGTASGTWLPMLTFDRTNTNVILVNKLAGAAAVGNAGTFLITLRRPHSTGM